MVEFRTIARVQDVADGEGVVIEVGNREIAVFRSGERFYALENTCCHRGGPLGDGTVTGTQVSCPWHMWEFDLETGACRNSPGDRVRTYALEVVGDNIRVRA